MTRFRDPHPGSTAPRRERAHDAYELYRMTDSGQGHAYTFAHPEYAHPAQSAPPHAPVDRVGGALREMLQITLPAIVLAIVVHLFLAQATVVYGQSMEPNLSPHQRLIVDKLSYRFHGPRRNEIVVIDMPGMDDMLVKRIVGLPGETVEIRDGMVYINGAPSPEPFPHDLGHTNMAPVPLAPLEYFVMGDNRDNSNDSRSFGPVHRESVVGRVWLRYWPIEQAALF
jgi:signal peptidase I